MKPIVVADANIPFLKGVLDNVAEMRYFPASQITPEVVREADALIVRTRTRCNAALLNNSKVKLITTATIGFDHVDAEYCQRANIRWQNAPGCNADSVGQYVASALCFWAKKRAKRLAKLTLGIVGCGHVGTSVEHMAQHLGMRVLRNDPPLQSVSGANAYVSLDEIAAKADVITFHTPLTFAGGDATYHLADARFFEMLRRSPLIINAARGGVIDERALLSALDNGSVSDCVVDCWENEPLINRTLLERALLATPHIAGYSADGKANATQACVRAVSRFFDLGLNDFTVSLPKKQTLFNNAFLQERLLENYPINRDSDLLKRSPETFEQQRSTYPVRRECEIR